MFLKVFGVAPQIKMEIFVFLIWSDAYVKLINQFLFFAK